MGWKIIQLVFGAQDVTIDFVPFGHAGLRISSLAKLHRSLHKPQPRARLVLIHWTHSLVVKLLCMLFLLPLIAPYSDELLA